MVPAVVERSSIEKGLGEKVRVHACLEPRLPRSMLVEPVTFVGKNNTGTVWFSFKLEASLTHHIV